MNEIEKAVLELKNGGVVAIPTETVYGLAANAASDEAVAKIYALKNRPSFNPLIVHIYSVEEAKKIAVFNDAANALAEKHWPGPLTLVLPKRDKNFARLATAGLDTIALRVPAHPVARRIIQESGLALAAPSANLSGELSPTKYEHVKKSFPQITVIDGGDSEVGLESTVVTFDGDEIVLLRPGVLQVGNLKLETGNKIISPGQLINHYSPKNELRINAVAPSAGEIFIGFGNMKCDLNLSEKSDLVEAAANLFAMLHKADEEGKPIAMAKIPNDGVGIAINDRLSRAAQK